jgi:hypothetical protein
MHKRNGIGKKINRRRLSDKVEKQTPPPPLLLGTVSSTRFLPFQDFINGLEQKEDGIVY